MNFKDFFNVPKELIHSFTDPHWHITPSLPDSGIIVLYTIGTLSTQQGGQSRHTIHHYPYLLYIYFRVKGHRELNLAKLKLIAWIAAVAMAILLFKYHYGC